jgi:hypothetical protein
MISAHPYPANRQESEHPGTAAKLREKFLLNTVTFFTADRFTKKQL